MSGFNINQDDLPWWCISVLSWIAMAQSIGEGSGKQMHAYREKLKLLMERESPDKLYKLYESFVAYQKSVAGGSESR